MTPYTTIVIAAYNEEQRLPETLARIDRYREETKMEAEIIVVDDGSTDGTAATVRIMAETVPSLRLLSYSRNRGKGYALRQGVLASAGSEVLLTDADLSTPIEEIETLREQLSLQGRHIAIGSRALAASTIVKAQPVWRRSMGQVFNRIVRMAVMDDFRDTQCGFKLLSGDIARELFREARIDRFAYDVEVLALAKLKGYRVVEVPVRWQNSAASKVHPLRDSLQMLKDVARIRLMIRARERAALVPVKTLLAATPAAPAEGPEKIR